MRPLCVLLSSCVLLIGCAASPGPGRAGDSGDPGGGTHEQTGFSDGGDPDGGAPDGGVPDGGVPDGGVPDGGVTDAGDPDAGGLPFGGADWAQYRFDLKGTWNNPGRLSRAEAKTLAPLWSIALGPYGLTQPVLAGGAVYLGTGYDARVVKLDAKTGQVLWDKDFDHVFDPAPSCADHPDHTGFFAAPAVVGDTVYAASPDGNLYALSTADGSVRWKVQVADPTGASHYEFVETSPSAPDSHGRIYLGIASVYGCDPVIGKVLAVDVRTHQVTSRALTDGTLSGAPVWSSIAVDEPTRRLFVTTGDPAEHALADVPLSQAFVSMNADTLEVLDHWQDPGPPPAEDADFGASPTLFETSAGKHLVAAANKDGWLYVLDREHLSAGPVWSYPLAQGGDPTSGMGSIVSPTFAHGTLYAAGGETPDGKPGSVVAFDPATGAVRWKHETPGYVIAAMPAVGDVLVVASNAADGSQSTLELLDLDTGEVLRSQVADSTTYGAPAIGGGLVLWSTFDGTVRALKLSETP